MCFERQFHDKVKSETTLFCVIILVKSDSSSGLRSEAQARHGGQYRRMCTGSNIRPNAVQVNMAHRSSEFKLFHSFWPNCCDRLWGWRPRCARSNYVVLPCVMFSLLTLLCLFSVFTCVLTLKRYSRPGQPLKKRLKHRFY